MGEELPILKGILKGVVNYHNARTYIFTFLSAVNIYQLNVYAVPLEIYTCIDEKVC